MGSMSKPAIVYVCFPCGIESALTLCKYFTGKMKGRSH